MLEDASVIAMVAVRDITVGKAFYGGTLGLKQTDENPSGVEYTCGGGRLFVYQSPTAGKNEATSASWDVDNLTEVVKALNEQGVPFEHYEYPGVEYEGDIHIMGGMRAAWFNDPDGNILGLNGVAGKS